ncbi:STAS domain-containing protein [Cellulomonas sp. ATA003]|uniref:STAS domain-containing protein n=1 Tax=Cellulomonas sp. ATA003 TaxID=3073064 RepID=UPI002873DB70|nr:STAS domain-containing protein [Cellulomonas sp. ATA003]WNB85552.1 STAS domain-containing protein [Cellulomonas sp. ATA003]
MDDSDGATTPAGITVEQHDGTTTVVLRGEIDASRRESASRSMVAVLAGDGPVVLDTSGVTFIDSSGLAFLLQVHGVATDAGRPVVLRDPSGAVVELLALVGLDTLFHAKPQEVCPAEVTHGSPPHA